MKINKFAVIVAEHEGKKISISIAQILEVLKIVNKLTCGEFYRMVRKIK